MARPRLRLNSELDLFACESMEVGSWIDRSSFARAGVVPRGEVMPRWLDLASNGAEKLPSANSTMRATASIIRIYLHQQKKSEGGPNFWRGRA
jgi:hypothetical protein